MRFLKFPRHYFLYASTIFLSAFLLFCVQPIAGKYILPWFGGSSSVWAVSLLFFTTMLFLGYAYVYVLTTYGGKRQALIHGYLICIAGLYALYTIWFMHASFPSLQWTYGAGESPSLSVLLALFEAVGLPYFLLSTTGPLLQYWYGLSSSREPYKLYALSNVASLLALVSYPFVIEPFIALHVQENVWIWLFVLFAISCAFVCYRFLPVAREIEVNIVRRFELSSRTARWILAAALPSFMLVATTTQITQVIAPVPLLWIVPLTLYLLTFIIAFAGYASSRSMPVVLLIAAATAYYYTPAPHTEILLQLGSYLALLFFCGLACHGYLYRVRPATTQLPLFYLFISFGGMLGTLCTSIIAPLIFNDFYEFPLGMALCAIAAIALLSIDFFPRIVSERWAKILRMLFALAMLTLFVRLVFADDGVMRISSRNFYGNADVVFASNGFIELMHGTTLHGLEYAEHASRYLPTTYYVPGSGIGRSILFEEGIQKKNAGIRVGIIGLGTGSAASYCRPGDSYTFYEIDPRIEMLAKTYFNYFLHCKNASVHLGDARITLEEERAKGQLGMYDLLAIDAFSDDTIPVHLLTLQALSLDMAHLRTPQSIIAVHTSNRYLDLVPVVFRLAQALHLSAFVVHDDGTSGLAGSPSIWVLLSKDPTVFQTAPFAHLYAGFPATQGPLWTDDYTSLLPILNFPKPW